MSDFIDSNLYDEVPEPDTPRLRRLLTEPIVFDTSRRIHQGVEVPVTFSGIY